MRATCYLSPIAAMLFAGCGTRNEPVPVGNGDLADLSVFPERMLYALPGVVQVESLVTVARPTHRIIHIRDWHYVPRDLYALDMRRGAGRELTEAEGDSSYEAFLQDVERVQGEQETLLRALAEQHGLRRVLVEGLTPDGMQAYGKALASIQETDAALTALQKKRATVDGTFEALDEKMQEVARGVRRSQIEFGATGRLAMVDVIHVLPLDRIHELENATPFRPDGTVQTDAVKLRRRHDWQVARTLEAGPVSVVVLGGEHDLSDSVRRLGEGTTEYLRVTTAEYRKAAGESK